MVADIRRLKSVGEIVPESERCLPMYNAVNQDIEGSGVSPFPLSRYARIHPDIKQSDMYLRVADQVAVFEHTGCIPEHSRTEIETRIRVVPCPEEVAKRCGGCVLNLTDGQELMDQLVKSADNPLLISEFHQ